VLGDGSALQKLFAHANISSNSKPASSTAVSVSKQALLAPRAAARAEGCRHRDGRAPLRDMVPPALLGTKARTRRSTTSRIRRRQNVCIFRAVLAAHVSTSLLPSLPTHTPQLASPSQLHLVLSFLPYVRLHFFSVSQFFVWFLTLLHFCWCLTKFIKILLKDSCWRR